MGLTSYNLIRKIDAWSNLCILEYVWWKQDQHLTVEIAVSKEPTGCRISSPEYLYQRFLTASVTSYLVQTNTNPQLLTGLEQALFMSFHRDDGAMIPCPPGMTSCSQEEEE